MESRFCVYFAFSKDPYTKAFYVTLNYNLSPGIFVQFIYCSNLYLGSAEKIN